MLASDLIATLVSLKEQHGDLPVVLDTDAEVFIEYDPDGGGNDDAFVIPT